MAVIGLDAADLSLIEDWSDRGLLPAFARLRREGTWINLKNRGEFPSTTIWPSIYTGTHPGRFGIYFIVRTARGKSKLELVGPEHCQQLPFWAHLQSCGKRSIVVDVPFTHPIAGLDGLQISNWGSYERYSAPISEPAHSLRMLRERFGRHPFGPELSRNAPVGHREFCHARRKLLAGVPAKGEMIRYLMRNHPWDFFMGVFAETHPAGHYFWDFHKSSRVSGTGAEFSSTLLDVYKSVDNEIGKIVEALDGRTTLLLVSGHGMGPNHVGWHLLPEVLRRAGHARSNGESVVDKKSRLLQLRESIPRRWRDVISHFLPNKLRDSLRIHWASSNVDWLNDRVISLPTDAHGFIRVNLKGRDSKGIVSSVAEYDEICRKVTRTLKDLVDLETGQPVVKDVFLTDEIFPGPERDSLPDLIVNWLTDKKIDSVHSKEVGTVKGVLPDPRSGNHRSEGFALLYGPEIPKGQRSEGHLLDIAPSVLRFYGDTPAASFDGHAWDDLV
jgi:predicted AlkP superfamily phosphohydrolase/phosphomutase